MTPRDKQLAKKNDRRTRTRALLFEYLENRIVLSATPRLAMVIAGFGGGDFPDEVVAELEAAGYSGVGDGMLSNWNSLTREGNPGGFNVSVNGFTEIPLPNGTTATFPLGPIKLSLVNLGDPASSNQVVSRAIEELDDPMYEDPNAQIVIIGHSLGGDTALKIAQGIAEKNPAIEIDVLALLDPVGFSGTAGKVGDIYNKVINIAPFINPLTGDPIPLGPVSIEVPVNDDNQTPGFFTDTNLEASSVPSNVGYFYNRWQTNGPFPIDYLRPDRQVTCNARVCDQGAQDTRDPYYLFSSGNLLDALAILSPQRFDGRPFETIRVAETKELLDKLGNPLEILTGNTLEIPTSILNRNFLKTNAQLHHNFPDNPTIQSDLIRIIRSIDPRRTVDRFEVNNTLADATHVSSSGSFRAEDLTIHTVEDVDYFRVTATDTGLISVSIEYCELDGELALEILDSGGKLIRTASPSGTPKNRVLSLAIAASKGEEFYVRVRSNNNGFNRYDLEITHLPLRAPNNVDLISSSDTGVLSEDNITRDTTPTTLIHADLRGFGAAGLILRPGFSDSDVGVAVVQLISDPRSGLILDQRIAIPAGNISEYLFEATSARLPDGEFVFSAFARLFDGTGSFRDSELSPPLTVRIDTTPPSAPTMNLDPGMDTGIDSSPATYNDRITRISTPAFVGRSDPDTTVVLFADAGDISNGVIDGSDTFIGQANAVPGGVTGSFPSGTYRVVPVVNSAVVVGGSGNGRRQIGAIAVDLAGNASEPSFLNIVIDRSPPVVTDIRLDEENGSVLGGKLTSSPTPPVRSLFIEYTGGPDGVSPQAPAIDPGLATNVGSYRLVGDHTGDIQIDRITVVTESPRSVVVQLEFSAPLPDDRYTLEIADVVSDAAGNRLDGESAARSPADSAAALPSGNGLPGGNFIGRFTIDSRPEIGTVSQGGIYLDINGNGIFDPQAGSDVTNRDFVHRFGQLTDAVFAGDFASPGADGVLGTSDDVSDGFDKLAAFGLYQGKYSFIVDYSNDGVPDFASVVVGIGNAIPIAGDFAPSHAGDEIGLFDGNTWYLDMNGDFKLDPRNEALPFERSGVPLVGDFNGDGRVDLGVFANDVNTFYFDIDFDGIADDAIEFGFSGFQERPIAGDLNLDGIDDIGLWVPGREGQLPENAGEWFFLLSDRQGPLPSLVFDEFTPSPLGNDAFAQFGSDVALPIFGNFDPPIAEGVALSTHSRVSYTNPHNPLDVNADGELSPLDALLVVEVLNRVPIVDFSGDLRTWVTLGGNYYDVTGDSQVTPLDVLAVIDKLSTGGLGEGEASLFPSGVNWITDSGAMQPSRSSPLSVARTSSMDSPLEAIDQVMLQIGRDGDRTVVRQLLGRRESSHMGSTNRAPWDVELEELFSDKGEMGAFAEPDL